MAVRAADVAAADRDERDDPAERESAGPRRLGARRGRDDGELECRSVRPGHEYVQLGGGQCISTPVPLQCVAPAGWHGVGRGWGPSAWPLRAAHGDPILSPTFYHA